MTRMRSLAQGDAVEEVDAGAFVAWVVPARVPLRPLWARCGDRVAVGNVRLDRSHEVREWGGMQDRGNSSLELVLRAHRVRGDRMLREITGDFGVVIYDATTHRAVAARDPFGIKFLCYRSSGPLLALASVADAIRPEDSYDLEFIADFLGDGDGTIENTIHAGVNAVVPGTTLHVANGGSIRIDPYWRPDDFEPREVKDEEACAAEFLTLFKAAIHSRLNEGIPTWAELSGGTDSSSIVSVAQTLEPENAGRSRLQGTVTIVDELGNGDERRYSDLVLAQSRLPNQEVVNSWAWQLAGGPPPRTDQPHVHYPYFARDALICALVRESGGRVLLSGLGSDHYLSGSRSYVADWIAAGRVGAGLAESIAWSIAERQSAWQGLRRDALEPFLPRSVHGVLARPEERLPPWIDRRFARRMDLSRHLARSRARGRTPGSRFALQTANAVRELPKWIPRGAFENGLELRFPFLSRPLVEFCMTLPPRMLLRPGLRKWVLRQAMRGVLPEPIRTRQGKGSIEARTIWSLARERKSLDVLLRDPILAQLGSVDPAGLRTAVKDAMNGRIVNLVHLLSTLSLETWLAVRSGRWPMGGQH
jgi:asparagine synthase (glutamine-hydrolysing)